MVHRYGHLKEENFRKRNTFDNCSTETLNLAQNDFQNFAEGEKLSITP